MRRSPLAAAFALCAALVTAGGPAAAQAPLKTSYTISLLGLIVGRADFETRLGARDYQVSGTLGSAGIGDIVSRTTGTSSVSGRIEGDRLFAERYRLDYRSDGKSVSSDVALRRGAVRSTRAVEEPAEPPPSDLVPVEKGQLRSVVDPLSGLMIRPGADPDAICRRTLPVYDGWTRLDLKLAPAGRRSYRSSGYSGEVVECAAKAVPVSGYRASSSGVAYLRAQTIRIAFAPVKDSGIWAPVDVRIPTKLGTVAIRANTFAAP